MFEVTQDDLLQNALLALAGICFDKEKNEWDHSVKEFPGDANVVHAMYQICNHYKILTQNLGHSMLAGYVMLSKLPGALFRVVIKPKPGLFSIQLLDEEKFLQSICLLDDVDRPEQ